MAVVDVADDAGSGVDTQSDRAEVGLDNLPIMDLAGVDGDGDAISESGGNVSVDDESDPSRDPSRDPKRSILQISMCVYGVTAVRRRSAKEHGNRRHAIVAARRGLSRA